MLTAGFNKNPQAQKRKHDGTAHAHVYCCATFLRFHEPRKAVGLGRVEATMPDVATLDDGLEAFADHHQLPHAHVIQKVAGVLVLLDGQEVVLL